MGHIYWIKTDGSEESVEKDISSEKVNTEFFKYIDIANQRFNGSHLEFVWVLHNNKRTLMIVDELGAIPVKSGYPLPINMKATDIYHNASRSRGKDWVGPPYIHGDVLLFEAIEID